MSVDERIYKDVQDYVFQKIRESVLMQKNITPANVNKPEEVKASQTNFAHYVIQVWNISTSFKSSGICYLVLFLYELGMGLWQYASILPSLLNKRFLIYFRNVTQLCFSNFSENYNFRYRIGIIKTPRFYFSKWVFGWGSIQILQRFDQFLPIFDLILSF